MRRLLIALGPLVVLLACGSSNDATSGDDDGGVDASTADGPSGSDGSPQPGEGGSPDGGNPSGPFCASLNPQPQLCEDFDDGTPPTNSDTQIDTGASCAIEQGTAKSTPSAYRCTVPNGVSSVTNALLRMAMTPDPAATRLVASFAFRPDAAAPSSTTQTLVIARMWIGSDHAVSIELTSENGPVLREQEGFPPSIDQPSGNLTKMPAAGQWVRYELSVDTSGKTATLKADGTQIASKTLTGSHYGTLFGLNLGLQSDSGFVARFDDVVLDWSK